MSDRSYTDERPYGGEPSRTTYGLASYTNEPTSYVGDPSYAADPKRYPTDSSLYSCTNLPPGDPYRYLKASEVRRQVDAAPDKKYRIPPKNKLSKSPETYKGKDQHFKPKAKSPWNEYPLTPEPGAVWRQGQSAERGAARVIYNKYQKDPFDVVYHDPTKGDGNWNNFNGAIYRDSTHVAKHRAYEREYDSRRTRRE